MKKARLEHRVRAVHCVLALAAALLAAVLVEGRVLSKLSGAGLGALLGYALGIDAWRRLRRQIDQSNIAVTYVEDGVLYAILVALYLVSFSPRLLLSAGSLAVRHPEAVGVGVMSISVASTAYTWVLYHSIREHERRFGPLRLKTFYARSMVGPESLVGRTGRVVDACQPEGRIKIDAELWFARSQDGTPLAAGTAVRIRDVEGLRLVVERKKDEAT